MTEAHFQLFDAVSSLIVLLDEQGRIRHWNQPCTDLTGYTLEEVQGSFFWDLRPISERAEIQAEFARALRTEQPFHYEYHWITKKGRRHWILWSTVVSRKDGVPRVIATGIDRTAEKIAKEELRVSEAKLAGILRIATDAIVSVDEHQKIIIYSEGAQAVFGWAAEEVLGQPLEVLIPEHARRVHREHMERFIAAPEKARRMGERLPEITGVRKSGEQFPAEAAISKLRTESGLFLTVVLHDISQRKALEDALRREVQARDDLTRTVVHDLRNPLNSIALQGQLLARTATTEVCSSPARRIVKASKRMARLLDDLLDAVRIQAGHLAVHEASLPVTVLLRDARESAAPLAANKQIDIEVQVPLEELGHVKGDYVRVLQVFDNLAGNAIKFTPEGGTVTLSAQRRGETVRFEVRDTGPGVPEEDVEQLFEPFWQAQVVDERGAGLGLTIARGIVEAHRGEIWAESHPGAGMVFSFTLPQRPAQNDGREDAEGRPTAESLDDPQASAPSSPARVR